MKHVSKMLACLRETKIQANVNKYEVYMQETKFLEMIVHQKEIRLYSYLTTFLGFRVLSLVLEFSYVM